MTKGKNRAARPRAAFGVQAQLRKPLERTLRAGHPWIYRDALLHFEAEPGTVVRVVDKQERFVAAGLAEAGPIGVRVFTLQDEAVDEALFTRRIEDALELRANMQPADSDAYRLLHGEGDRLPGIVCDRYGRCAVLRLDGEAVGTLRELLVRVLQRLLPPLGVDGLLLRTGRKHEHEVEPVWGQAPEREIEVREHGMTLCANLFEGQKTGLFLDHRESRARVRSLAAGKRVLNLYGYTGGFSVAAGLGGATHVTTVDIAKPALQLADATWRANGLDPAAHVTLAGDALEILSAAIERREQWDLIVADPPNFAPRENVRDNALAAYEALHTAVLRVLTPRGLYLAASCSSHVTRADFEATLAAAGLRVRKILQVLERSGAPADHPKLLAFPEGDYLKVVLMRAL